MKKILLLICVVFTPFITFASSRSQQEAYKIAQSFQHKSLSSCKQVSPRLELAQRVDCIDDSPAYYVFNKPNGFIIVSGNDQLPDILAYSYTDSFVLEDAPDAFISFMNQFKQSYNKGTKSSIKKSTSKMHPQMHLGMVGPLLGATKWNQSSPYNDLCPYVVDGDTTSKRCAIGCVATAMSQIMYYYKYPTVPSGVSKSYTTRNGKHFCLSNFDTSYDWNNILPSYNGKETKLQKSAISRLCFDVAVSVEMNFDRSSGAYTADVVSALPTYFGYDVDIFFYHRSSYTYDEWIHLLKQDLDLNYPILYRGQSLEGAHAFVCDGYKGDYFHINWGWGGMCNGYFYLYSLVPESQGIGGGSADGYNYSQAALLGIHPPDGVNEVREGVLSYSSSDFSQKVFSQTVPIQVTLKHLVNSGFDVLNGTVSVDLFNANDTTYNSQIQTSYLISDLKIGYYYPSFGLYNCSFASIADGSYLIGFSYELTGGSRIGMKNTSLNLYEYYPVLIKNGQITISDLHYSVDLVVNQFNLVKPVNCLYADNVAIVEFDITNNSFQDFEGQYIVQLSNADTIFNLAQYRLFLRPNKLEHIDITLDLTHVIVDDYSMNIMIDTLQRNDIVDVLYSGWDGFRNFASISVPVNLVPDGEVNLQVFAPIYFDGGDVDTLDADLDIYVDSALLKVPLTNLGVFGSKRIRAYVFPEHGGLSLGGVSQSVLLDSNDSIEAVFDFSGYDLQDEIIYRIGLYYDGALDPSTNSHIYMTWHTEPLLSNYSLISIISFTGSSSSSKGNYLLSVPLINTGYKSSILLQGIIKDIQGVELKKDTQSIQLNTNSAQTYIFNIHDFVAQSGSYQFEVNYLENSIQKYFELNKSHIIFDWVDYGVNVDLLGSDSLYVENGILYNPNQSFFTIYDVVGHRIVHNSVSVLSLLNLKSGIYLIKTKTRIIKISL